ncbi:MAG: MaoC/PaaZ C-terminal domain-containing protein [Anaerolineae bacterium]
MADAPREPRGLYFEDLELGSQIISVGRTITETDVVNFAGLSGDYNQIHTDQSYAEGAGFKQRVAHGLLVLSIASGLAVQTGFMEGTVIAFRDLETKFSTPVFFGDTIHVILEIKELKALPKLGGGQVVLKVTIKNQNGKAVQRGNWTMLIKSKPI